MPRDISWLSPRRRRTTTALPTVNGISRKNGAEDEGPLSPSPRFTSPKPVLPPPPPGLKQRSSRTFSSASTTSITASPEADGNLFYAYARQAEDNHCRYLLTFASAHVANEWWSLVRSCFPDTMRAGPQLFSFKAADFLEQAWKHPTLAHLKPKWMYIQCDGATQGVIPVQDARGNMMGGPSSELWQRPRDEPRRDERASKLEERFEKMMAVVEKNTEQMSALAQARSDENKAPTTRGPDGMNGMLEDFGTSDVSGHLDRIAQLLEQNSAHIASLTQRQAESEQRMREMAEAQHARETPAQPDMGQLTSNLDRMQKLMERNAQHERKDSARDIRASPPRIDFSPLTFWLEKGLSAVEQNSELMKEALREKKVSTPSLPAQQLELDLSPLSQRLDDLLDAQEAKATRDQEGYSQMNYRLDKIHEAQHKAVERGPFDVSLLSQRLDEILSVHRDVATTTITDGLEAIRAASEENSNHLVDLLEAHHESNLGEKISHSLESLTEHIEALRSTTEHYSDTLIELLESQPVGRQAVAESNRTALSPFDDDPSSPALTQQQGPPGFGDSKFLLSALTSHLSKIQAVTESNAKAVRATRESNQALQKSLTASITEAKESSHTLQKTMTTAVSDTSSSVRALAAKHKDLAAQAAVREGQVKEVVRTQADMAECVRELAKTIKTQEKPPCSHVVVPPPRKTTRKVVGYVYE